MNSQRVRVALPVLLVMACCMSLRADDDTPAADWQPYFRDLAVSYRITADAAPGQPLALHETPVLRWNQPVRGGDDGAVYLWLRDGRPAVIGTMFCWPHPDGYRVVTNEFHSFLSEPLTAARNDEVVWQPQEGVTWTKFGSAAAPASSAARRLIQMRQLAGRFRGENIDNETGQSWPLRLLPQPLFRYDLSERIQTAENPVLDGALFALASGTDPEILVLLEARMTRDGERWHWALARFSDRALTAWLDDEKVWSVEHAQPTPTTAHTILNVDQLVRPPQIRPQEEETP